MLDPLHHHGELCVPQCKELPPQQHTITTTASAPAAEGSPWSFPDQERPMTDSSSIQRTHDVLDERRKLAIAT